MCRLLKSLYGLKQASRQWFATLAAALCNQGYTQSKNDYSLFLKHKGSHLTIVAVYVDDIHSLKSFLHNEFTIKDLGNLHYFLGIGITYVP